jgi:hypothetical protein
VVRVVRTAPGTAVGGSGPADVVPQLCPGWDRDPIPTPQVRGGQSPGGDGWVFGRWQRSVAGEG